MSALRNGTTVHGNPCGTTADGNAMRRGGRAGASEPFRTEASVVALLVRTVVSVVAGFCVSACDRTPAVPAKDVVQEAFRDEGLTTRQQAQGHRLFVQRCATCHGTQGRGDGQNAYNLDPAPPDFQESLARLPVAGRRKLIESGSVALGRSPLCPPRGGSLSADEVDALLAWLEVASHLSPGGAAEPAPGRRWRRSAAQP